jgi:hypothetical protein
MVRLCVAKFGLEYTFLAMAWKTIFQLPSLLLLLTPLPPPPPLNHKKSFDPHRTLLWKGQGRADHTAKKIRNKYYQKWNCAASFPNPTFMYLWAIYIFPRSVCLFYCVKYRNRSQIHECGNWERGRAVSFLGIHKSDLLCSTSPSNPPEYPGLWRRNCSGVSLQGKVRVLCETFLGIPGGQEDEPTEEIDKRKTGGVDQDSVPVFIVSADSSLEICRDSHKSGLLLAIGAKALPQNLHDFPRRYR